MAAKKRRSPRSSGRKKTTRTRRRKAAPTLKAAFVEAGKFGALAAGGAVLGEMVRQRLLRPKADGSPSALAKLEADNPGPVGAAITALPGLALGGGLYALGRKQKNKSLMKGGVGTMTGAATLGTMRLVLANPDVSKRVRVTVADSGAPAQLPQSPAEGGGGEFFGAHPPAYLALQGHPPAYQTLQDHPPAYQTLQDTYVSNPYGDSYVDNPYGDTFVSQPPAPSYVDRVRRRRAPHSTVATSAMDELR